MSGQLFPTGCDCDIGAVRAQKYLNSPKVTVAQVGHDKCNYGIGTVQSLFSPESPDVTFTTCWEKQHGKARCGCLERPDIHNRKEISHLFHPRPPYFDGVPVISMVSSTFGVKG